MPTGAEGAGPDGGERKGLTLCLLLTLFSEGHVDVLNFYFML